MRSALHRPSRLAGAILAILCGAAAADPKGGAGDGTDAAADSPPAQTFVWRPELALTPLYDDNIYALPTDQIADWVWILSPLLSGESQWDRHSLAIEAGGEFGRHDRYTSEDYDDGWVNAEGRYDLAAGTSLFGGVGASQEHEDRGSPDAVAPTINLAAVPAAPTVYTALTAQAGVTQQFGDELLRAGATFERLDYDDVPSLAGPDIDNDDRDRRVLGVAVRLAHRLDDQRDLFVQAQWNRRRYDQTPDDYGYDRDSDGYRLAVGFKGALGPGLAGEAYVGYLVQDYEDPRFDRVRGPDFAGKLDWRVAPPTAVRLTLERTVNETDLEGSSSYLYTNLGATVSHQLDERTTLRASAGAGLAAYQDVGRDDWLYTAGVSAQYRIVPQVYVTAGYAAVRRDSNEDGGVYLDGLDLYDYDRQQVYLTISVLDTF